MSPSGAKATSIDNQNAGPVWLVIETSEENRIAIARLVREFFPEMNYAVLAKVVAGAKVQLGSNVAEKLREALEERGGRATIWKV